MRLRIVVSLITAIGFTMQVESINLRGKITNKNGRGINKAIVTLIGKGFKDTTDVNGNYSIYDGAVVGLPIPLLPASERITLKNSVISLSLVRPSAVQIETFDMNGRLIKKALDTYASAGVYRFDILKQSNVSGMSVIKVSINNNVSTFRYMPFNNGIKSSSPLKSVGIEKKEELARALAAVDSLKVSALNYKDTTVPVFSYEGEINITMDSITLAKFSFFVTSLKAIQKLSGSQNGFGGDFRFGKTGQGAGLLGADSICECIAEMSMPGSKVKKWRAFLSVTKGPDGKQVNAIDRIGRGPWYDRTGRKFSDSLPQLLNTRPAGAEAEIKNDLPNEDGIPNHYPEPGGPAQDNHHFVTGSKTDGTLYSSTATCDDWTSTTATGKPRCGFSWPRNMGGGGAGSSGHWISGFDCCGCAAGIQITNTNDTRTNIIGCAGGYGGFYCFALNP